MKVDLLQLGVGLYLVGSSNEWIADFQIDEMETEREREKCRRQANYIRLAVNRYPEMREALEQALPFVRIFANKESHMHALTAERVLALMEAALEPLA